MLKTTITLSIKELRIITTAMNYYLCDLIEEDKKIPADAKKLDEKLCSRYNGLKYRQIAMQRIAEITPRDPESR